jgi:hypothetical protein
MKLNILSDLHLSLGALPVPENDADVVVLAGDIARPREAASWARGFGKRVLYVPGNHEFYGTSIARTIAELRELCAGTSVCVLDNEQTTIDGVRFLGTTLWTDFMLSGAGEQREAAIREALKSMRDFTRIRAGDALESSFTPADSAALFSVNAAWLEAELARPYPGPTVVIRRERASIRGLPTRC